MPSPLPSLGPTPSQRRQASVLTPHNSSRSTRTVKSNPPRKPTRLVPTTQPKDNYTSDSDTLPEDTVSATPPPKKLGTNQKNSTRGAAKDRLSATTSGARPGYTTATADTTEEVIGQTQSNSQPGLRSAHTTGYRSQGQCKDIVIPFSSALYVQVTDCVFRYRIILASC